MGKVIKWTLIVGLLVVATGIGGLLYGREWLREWSVSPVSLLHETTVELPRGMSLRRFGARLASQGLVSSDRAFHLWVRFFRDYSQFQAGAYRFQHSATPEQIIETIIRGDVYVPIALQLTIPEGFTVRNTFDRLVARGVGSIEELQAINQDKNYLKELKVPSSTLEGFLYPATYTFSEFPDARQAISTMVKTFWEKLPKGYEAEVGERGLSLQEAVTFASLIELETRLEDEKAKVSEVIWNRLNRKIALAIDASIIYGIEDFQGDLKWKHLDDKSNPYNTRVHRGLPPTPIGSPARSSLEAVLTPTSEGYYYYVLNLKDGSRHHFSKTLKEHNKHVRELVREKKRR